MDATRFLVTEDAGRLARWLRLLGYDTALAKNLSLSELYRKAYNEGRIVLTRNRRIGASSLFRVIQLQSQDFSEQLQQIRCELRLPEQPVGLFSRCDRCNVPVEQIEKPQVEDRVPPYVYQTQERFSRCPSCGRVYWKATHCASIRRVIDQACGGFHA